MNLLENRKQLDQPSHIGYDSYNSMRDPQQLDFKSSDYSTQIADQQNAFANQLKQIIREQDAKLKEQLRYNESLAQDRKSVV